MIGFISNSADTLGWPALLLTLDRRLFVLARAVQVALTLWDSGLVNTVYHRSGARPQDTGDRCCDTLAFALVT